VALRSDGTVRAWGHNNYGQVGDGTKTNRQSPVQVSGLANVVAIAGARDHTVALRGDGTIWAWGDNEFGNLGIGTTANHSTPVQVHNLANMVAIAGGRDHSLAVAPTAPSGRGGGTSTARSGTARGAATSSRLSR
jgi:alpha-tubulin suppressor-like RCC1 family protein